MKPGVISAETLERLAKWHERRAKVKRTTATQDSDPILRSSLLANADTHDVSPAVLRKVLEGFPVEEL